jgi:HEAT repeat protein
MGMAAGPTGSGGTTLSPRPQRSALVDAERPTAAMPAPNRLENLQTLRNANVDAALTTAFGTLVTGAFMVGFIKHLGGADVWIGLMAAIPSLLGVLQIPGAIWGRGFATFKSYVLPGVAMHRASYVPLVVLPLLPIASDVKLILLALSVAVASAAAVMVTPVYSDWLAELVPAKSRGSFFSSRNAIATAVGALVGVLGGALLDLMRRTGNETLGFSLIFFLGVLCAGSGFLMFLRMRDLPRPNPVRQDLAEGVRALRMPFGDRQFRKVLVFLAVFIIGQSFAGPLFAAYALESLRLPFTILQLMAVMHAIGNVLSARFWGFLSDKYGNKPMLMLAGLGVTLTPFMWLATFPGRDLHNTIVLLAGHVFVGVVWGGVAVCQFNLLLSTARPEERGTYIGAGMTVQAVVGGVAPLAGAWMLTSLRGGFEAEVAYKIVFVGAILLRLAAVFALQPVREEGSARIQTALKDLGKVTPRGYLAMRSLRASSDVQSREKAIRSVATEDYTLGADEIVKALRDPSPRVRRQAASALARLQDPNAAEALVRHLEENPDLVEEETVEALGELGHPEAVAVLVRYLQIPRSLVRRAAAKALGRLGDPEAVEALTIAAAEPGDADLRRAALQALRLLGARQSASTIADALYDPHPSVRIAAAEAVAELGLAETATNLRRSLEYFQDEAASEVAYALGAVGSLDDIPTILGKASSMVSATTRRRCLLGVARLLGVERETYRLLLLEGMARDAALLSIFRSLLRKERSLRKPLDLFSAGEETDFLRELAAAWEDPVLDVLAAHPAEESSFLAILHLARPAGSKEGKKWRRAP